MAEEGFDMAISPDGTVEFEVVGGKGRGCLKMAEELKAALGEAEVTSTDGMYQKQQPAQKLKQNRGGSAE